MIKTVTLTHHELLMCTWVGKCRNENAQRLNRDPGKGPCSIDRGPQFHIRGAKCEYAASIIMNRFWRPSIGIVGEPDVGGMYETRSTNITHGRLIIKPKDYEGGIGKVFILILDQEPVFTALGWYNSLDAKSHPLNTAHGDPAHYINQRDLGDIEALP